MRTAENVTTLSWDDARARERGSEVLLAAVPTYSGQGSAEHRDRNWQTRVTGTTAGYFDVNAEVQTIRAKYSSFVTTTCSPLISTLHVSAKNFRM